MHLYPTKTCLDEKCKGNEIHWTGKEYKKLNCDYCGRKLMNIRVLKDRLNGKTRNR